MIGKVDVYAAFQAAMIALTQGADYWVVRRVDSSSPVWVGDHATALKEARERRAEGVDCTITHYIADYEPGWGPS